jgi:hypothetical protein
MLLLQVLLQVPAAILLLLLQLSQQQQQLGRQVWMRVRFMLQSMEMLGQQLQERLQGMHA